MTTLAPVPWTEKWIGPRVVGGLYFSGYWQMGYTVLAVDREIGDDLGWSITVRWADGHTGTHCTPWDRGRDRVIEEGK